MHVEPRQRLILPIADWPALDRAAWEKLFVLGGPLEPDGVRAQWCLFTRTTHAESYGRWLRFLTHINELNPYTAPSERITHELIRRYVAYLECDMGSVTLAQRIEHLCMIARSFDPACELRWLVRVVGRLRARARPRQRPMPPRVAEVFRAGIDQMRLVDTEARAGLRTRAATYRNGLAVAMLAAAPIRALNLATIEIGKQLKREGDVYWLRFAGPEMKNRRPFDCPLPPVLTQYIERYLETHRPALLTTTSRRLFVSMRGRGISKAGLSERVKFTTRRILGKAINPHAFRHMAATWIAIEDPANVGIATPLLGHTSREVTSRHYSLASLVEAGRMLGKTIQELRRNSRTSRRLRRSMNRAGHEAFTNYNTVSSDRELQIMKTSSRPKGPDNSSISSSFPSARRSGPRTARTDGVIS